MERVELIPLVELITWARTTEFAREFACHVCVSVWYAHPRYV